MSKEPRPLPQPLPDKLRKLFSRPDYFPGACGLPVPEPTDPEELRTLNRQRFLDDILEVCREHGVSVDIDYDQLEHVPEMPAFVGKTDASGHAWLVSIDQIESALREGR